MSIIYNGGKNPTVVKYNNKDLDKVTYNGTVVWQKGEPYSATLALAKWASVDGSGSIGTSQIGISSVSGASGKGFTVSGNTLIANNALSCSVKLNGSVCNAYSGADVEATMDVTGGYVYVRKNGSNVMSLTIRNSGSFGNGNRNPTAGSTSGSFSVVKGDKITFFGGGFAITHDPPHHTGSGFVYITNISAVFSCKL